ncbi:hypothetical protein SARC_03173 [Sphaeroforma arctica JP610]|uniref:Uncharacterized protein n=1 Tax=Sphaeroforma arctica JP610 TaxID=667725 RepID=A0A0L0G6H1_9EUKA|nr:hypothetical protein SARC_03173 [Sphaeroforma arctica JP610]KNC84605.1 hypothetical protein SARC_03173 [Sphaeroforma arctica JP610]|eukprot:XP_014158507.1 hypothetical protein SARC_03173 [Sphaeroforma arctica JP610]
MSSKSISAADAISKAEKTILEAEDVKATPLFPENLPTEAEIDIMYAEIDDYKEQLRKCRLCREKYMLKIQWLESDIESLTKRKKDLMEGILERRDDFEELSAQCVLKVEVLDSDIQHLMHNIIVIEEDIAGKLEVLSSMTDDQDTMEGEKTLVISANNTDISELEGKIAAMREGNVHMRDFLQGRNSGNSDLQRSLEISTNENVEKSRVIIEYLDNVESLLEAMISGLPKSSQGQCLATDEAIALEDSDPTYAESGVYPSSGDDADASVSTHALIYVLDCLVEKTRLRQSRDLQLEVLEQLADSLAEGRLRTAKHIEKESARLVELQNGAADYLNIEPKVDDYADNFANLKRLLGIMVEKAKKQAVQISTLLYILEKKDQMNDVMAEKVKEIALEQMKTGNLLRNARQNKGKAKKISSSPSKRQSSSASKTSKISK